MTLTPLLFTALDERPHKGDTMKLQTILSMIASVLIASTANTVAAQTYPAGPIRMIVPFTAGGGADFVSRIYAERLSKSLGVPVVVENRVGANGNIGADAVAKAKPDGYTLLFASNTILTVNPSLYRDLPFNVQRDFAPVAQVAVQQTILVVHPSLPVNSVQELVELAKQKPGALNYASGGNGSSGHLSGELLKSVTGVKMEHIPYKGSAPATNDLVGGQVLIMFNNLPPALPFIASGKLRALAVTGPKRSPAAPNTPTMAEAGFPAVEVVIWNAVMVPAGTPASIVAKLNDELTKIAQLPEVKERLAQDGTEATSSTPQEVTRIIQDETVKWKKVVDSGRIQP